MPQVGATAPWGDVERGEERALRDETTETYSDRRRSGRPRPVRASGLDVHPRPTRVAPVSVASADFDFASARAASEARRRSGSARPAAQFAEPVVEVALAPAPARSGQSRGVRPAVRRPSAARDAIEAPPRRSPEGRRIVTITGRGSERYAPAVERRRSTRAYEREGFRPDRAAMWAVLLGVLMILAAATSAHGAVLAHHAAHALSHLSH